MMPLPAGKDGFGSRHSDRLLDSFFRTDAAKLPRTFRRLNETQSTLYTVNAFCGQIYNGGISQFFLNAKPVLRDGVEVALNRIGAEEVSREYVKLCERLKGNDRLATIRTNAEHWNDSLAYKETLEAQSPGGAFDNWFLNGQQANLDRLMRTYISGRENDLVRFCDDERRLEVRWICERLVRLVEDYDRYQLSYESGGTYTFFDLLFKPELRPVFGATRDDRRENARILAARLIPSIRKATLKPKTASYSADPNPQIVVGRSGLGDDGRVIVAYHEDAFDMLWLISEWD